MENFLDTRYEESWRQSDYCLHLMTKRGEGRQGGGGGSRFSVAYGEDTASSSNSNSNSGNNNNSGSSSNYSVTALIFASSSHSI